MRPQDAYSSLLPWGSLCEEKEKGKPQKPCSESRTSSWAILVCVLCVIVRDGDCNFGLLNPSGFDCGVLKALVTTRSRFQSRRQRACCGRNLDRSIFCAGD